MELYQRRDRRVDVVGGRRRSRRRPDAERLKTIDYGGGARWFAKPHLAFSFDVRFYAINPSHFRQPGWPEQVLRTTLFVVGAGVSIK